ncbi:cleavage stimulation factor subunit 2-like [Tubulanus polymorphus]|uniref:cleavage stimulation factor subunit 2-like n=1 Tax=Tubulanus polymorphus TaxID=672921 RepID=UPI003DA5622C
MAAFGLSSGGGGGQQSSPLSATERAQRSVFVGNIPYEATEESLKDIFCQAGPVVSFRIVYDRETGKPKGYGFCEYQDVETAQSAMRNLNNADFNGRPLRVGAAAGEQTKDESKTMQQAIGGPVIESPFGDPVEPKEAPEAISRAVASLPPEQMYELMKQMKLCVQNNPTEARNMLLKNPQLAYALLQAQIVMKIVDPQVAMAMLHRERDQIPPVQVGDTSNTVTSASVSQQNPMNQAQMAMAGQQLMGMQGMPNMPVQQRPNTMSGGMPNMGGPAMGASRMAPGMPPAMAGFPGNPGNMPFMPGMGGPNPGGQSGGAMPSGPGMPNFNRPQMNNMSMPGAQPTSSNAGPSGNAGISSQDQEKAALIMQVLQLSDEQIARLPPDQRQSILILKDQIARSST